MIITEEKLQNLKKRYPVGTRIELENMDDVQAPPSGTIGTVIGVDDIGSLLMRWDNGSGLNLLPGVDKFKRLNSND